MNSLESLRAKTVFDPQEDAVQSKFVIIHLISVVAQNNVVRHAEQHDQNAPNVGVIQAKFGCVKNCDRNDYLDCFRLRPKTDFLAVRNFLIHFG